jgi:anti-sigma B factor antagonist
MTIQSWSENIWVIRLGEEPLLSEDLVTIKNHVQSHHKMPDMVLDFSSVTRLNSSNLSQLLRLRELATEHNARILLAGPNNKVWAVFLMTGLDRLFEVMPDVPTALAGIQIKNNP